MDISEEFLNELFWVAGNLLIGYIAIVLPLFVIGYYVLFDPSATTAGKLIFRFMLSIVGVSTLLFVRVYVTPGEGIDWSTMPDNVSAWMPITRVIVYGYVSFTITSLAVLLALRKWKPKKLKTSEDVELVKVRHTTSIDIIKD